MDGLRTEQIKEHYKNFPTPVIILDKELNCAYCNKPSVLPEGTSMKLYMQKDIDIPVVGVVNVMIMLNGVSYCGRFEQYEEYIKCELFDSDDIQAMAEKTDFFGKGEKFLYSAMQSVSRLRGLTNTFRNAIDNKAEVFPELCSEYFKVLSCLSSAVNNAFEYNTMLSKAPEPQPVNVVVMVRGIVERCNTILSKCGRCIDFIYDLDNLYISADKRYAFNALVNLIHNALVYSPRDCVPVVSLTALKKDGKDYVFLKASNETALFDENACDGFNSGFYRLGFGKKMIKLFAEQSDGEYIENITGDRANIGVLLPLLNVSRTAALTLECDEVERYDTGIPDLLDVKMQEVTDFFGVIT